MTEPRRALAARAAHADHRAGRALSAGTRRAGRRRPARPPITGWSARSSDKLEPETEADPVAILSQLLVAFGAAVGRGAFFQVEATRHHPQRVSAVDR